MQFIGRVKELAFLEKCYKAPDAQLVVMYGRRRVGKTECLRQFSQDKPCIWYSCTKDTDALQLRAFSRRVIARASTAARYIDAFSSWEDAFEELARISLDERLVVVIDEFPYAVEGNRSIPSVLQNVWDNVLSRSNVMIVLCGSSISFMEDDLLGEKNPLYGRATGVWKMDPLGYDEAVGFFPGYTPQQKLEAYGILGGVPYYLRQFDSTRTIGENVCDAILARGCALYSEADFLMRQELREPAVYNAVLGAVAAGETELNGIAQKTLLDARTANTYLRKLESLHIVEREFSVQAGQQERAKSSRGLWRVKDNFIAFWYAAVQPYQSELDAGAVQMVWERFIAPRLNSFVSSAFEDVCRQWLRRRNMAGELPFFYQSMGRWWSGSAEIDAVAAGQGNAHLLGECKFKDAPVGPDVLRSLDEKGEAYFPRGERWLWLFSKAGYTQGGAWAADVKNARLVYAGELEQ